MTGATIGKGLNRMIATILGGALGFGTHYLANLCGDKGQPLILGALVFVVGTRNIPLVLNYGLP